MSVRNDDRVSSAKLKETLDKLWDDRYIGKEVNIEIKYIPISGSYALTERSMGESLLPTGYSRDGVEWKPSWSARTINEEDITVSYLIEDKNGDEVVATSVKDFYNIVANITNYKHILIIAWEENQEIFTYYTEKTLQDEIENIDTFEVYCKKITYNTISEKYLPIIKSDWLSNGGYSEILNKPCYYTEYIESFVDYDEETGEENVKGAYLKPQRYIPGNIDGGIISMSLTNDDENFELLDETFRNAWYIIINDKKYIRDDFGDDDNGFATVFYSSDDSLISRYTWGGTGYWVVSDVVINQVTEITLQYGARYYHKLSPQYIPEMALRQSDWNSNDDESTDYITNRPFGKTKNYTIIMNFSYLEIIDDKHAIIDFSSDSERDAFYAYFENLGCVGTIHFETTPIWEVYNVADIKKSGETSVVLITDESLHLVPSYQQKTITKNKLNFNKTLTCYLWSPETVLPEKNLRNMSLYDDNGNKYNLYIDENGDIKAKKL